MSLHLLALIQALNILDSLLLKTEEEKKNNINIVSPESFYVFFSG